MMTQSDREYRPRFSEREGLLLLAAVFIQHKESPNDREWYDLAVKLGRLSGYDADEFIIPAHRQPARYAEEEG